MASSLLGFSSHAVWAWGPGVSLLPIRQCRFRPTGQGVPAMGGCVCLAHAAPQRRGHAARGTQDQKAQHAAAVVALKHAHLFS